MKPKKIHLAKDRFTTFCGKRRKNLRKSHIKVSETHKGVSCKVCQKSFKIKFRNGLKQILTTAFS